MSAFARSPADRPAFSPAAFSPGAFAAPAPAPLPDDTLALVRGNVRDMLLSSPAFRALPAEKQREVAHNTVKVARFIADAGGETAGVPMTAVITNPAARPLAAPARPFAPPPIPTTRKQMSATTTRSSCCSSTATVSGTSCRPTLPPAPPPST